MTAATVPMPPGGIDPLTIALPPLEVAGGGVSRRRAVPYSVLPGFRPLELDLYLPPATGGRKPIVLFVHGGGWRVGSRRSFGPAFDALTPGPFELIAAAGFVVASIDYRLSGETVFPAQLDDVKAALNWLSFRADELDADPERIVLWGESAGGHLAALAGLTAEKPGVVGVIDWYGPADLSTMQAQLLPGSPTAPDSATSRESALLGRPLGSSPELAAAASPVRYVQRGAPAFHLAHGLDDHLVPAAQSRQLHAALRELDVPSDCLLLEGADHLWAGLDDPLPVLHAALEFARQVTLPAHP